MNNVLHDYIGDLYSVYVDFIIIYSRSFDAHA